MAPGRRWFRSPGWQRFGKWAGLRGRRIAGRIVGFALPIPTNLRIEQLPAPRRVLLVRPNFRIGNTVITTPLIPALRERFPDAELHVLGADTTKSLLAHLPLDALHVVSRRFLLRPWEFVALIRRLRALRFDFAIEAGMGSFSGCVFTYLSGARYRIGVEGSGERFLNVRVPRPVCAHSYDRLPGFARSFGATCEAQPSIRVDSAERVAAAVALGDCGIVDPLAARGFIAVFVGGHEGKRLAHSDWIEILNQLDRNGVRFAVLVGPEEHGFAQRVKSEPALAGAVIQPPSLRSLAAILSRADLVVTPDSGPMHLAAAVGCPTIALLQLERSRRFEPRGPADRVLFRPSAGEVVEAIRRHPTWGGLVRGGPELDAVAATA
jgi:heptosyltransferase-3